jgi:hypothetical protein
MLVYQRVPHFQTCPHPHDGLCRLGSKVYLRHIGWTAPGQIRWGLEWMWSFFAVDHPSFWCSQGQGGPFYHILIYSTDHGAPASDVGEGAQHGLQRFLEVFAQKYSG